MSEFFKNKRIVNLRYMCEGLHFDAAIDCDWTLHFYENEPDERRDVTPIELYCMDRPDWDIHMMYHREPEVYRTNEQQEEFHGGIFNTAANFEEILEETKKWIQEMNNQ